MFLVRRGNRRCSMMEIHGRGLFLRSREFLEHVHGRVLDIHRFLNDDILEQRGLMKKIVGFLAGKLFHVLRRRRC